MTTNVCYQGDCLEVMKGIEDKSIDMILCDLPYGTTACKWDTIIPFEPLWEQYKRIIKDNGAIVLTSSQPFTSSLVVSCIELFKYQWVWKKNNPTGFQTVKTQPMKEHEDVLVFSKGTIASGSKRNMKYFPQGLIKSGVNKVVANKPKYIGARPNQDGKEYIQEFTNYPRSILEFSRDSKTVHPTQKPVALFEYLIKTYTSEGDLVLDNTAGSGTTGVACKNTNRNLILIEQDEKYCDIIKERVGCEIIKGADQDCFTEEFKANGKWRAEGIADKLIELEEIKKDRISKGVCQECGGKIIKLKSGIRTCEDCLTDY